MSTKPAAPLDCFGRPALMVTLGAKAVAVTSVDEFGAIHTDDGTYNPGAMPTLDAAVYESGKWAFARKPRTTAAQEDAPERAEPLFRLSHAAATLLMRAHIAARWVEVTGTQRRTATTLVNLGMLERTSHNAMFMITLRGHRWVEAMQNLAQIEGHRYAAAVRVDYSDKGAAASNAALNEIDAARDAMVRGIRRLFKLTAAQAKTAAVEYADQGAGTGLIWAVGVGTGRY